MKMLNSFGPNPRMLRMFLAEKGLELPMVQLDLLGGENRGAAYTAKNPGGQTPALELDDGVVHRRDHPAYLMLLALGERDSETLRTRLPHRAGHFPAVRRRR